MSDLDLSLSDALTDGAAQPGPEAPVQRDFVAQLEAEPFDDKVGETVAKTDYVPLLDNDDTTRPGGQMSALRPEPQGEGPQGEGPRSFDQQQATDFLSASMECYSDPDGSQTSSAQMMDPGLMGAFTAFSQPGGLGVEVGAAPLSSQRVQRVAEAPPPPVGPEAPRDHSPMRPEPQPPRSPLDPSAGPLGRPGPDDLPFSPSVSTAIGRHAGHLAADPPGREGAADAGGDERERDGSDRKQKRKKKRRQKDEGAYEPPESRAQHPEVQAEDTPPTEEFYHRVGPRRDRGDGCWEEPLGRSGGRGKKGKSRKRLPEEWGASAEPSQLTEEMDLGGSAQGSAQVSLADMDPGGGLAPPPLSEALFSPAAAPFNPLVLSSELKATAAPFTMPSSTPGSAPTAPRPGDPFDLLMETEDASLRVFSPGGDAVDGAAFHARSLRESRVRGTPEGDTSPFSPASQPSPSPRGRALASAPPLSPSDASWLLSDATKSSGGEPFDFGDLSATGHPLTLGLTFDTPSPAPLRSPRTTAQEFQHKDADSAQKRPETSRSSSSSVKSPSSPGANHLPPLAPPQSPGSGLNPTARPFFPCSADPLEEPAPPPTSEVKPDKMEEEKEDSVEKEKLLEPLVAEQRSVKVEYAVSETPAKVEKEVEKEKEKEMKDAGITKEVKVKVTEVEEKKETEKEKVKVTEQKAVKVDWMTEEEVLKVEKVVRETEVEKDQQEKSTEELQQKEMKEVKTAPQLEEEEEEKQVNKKVVEKKDIKAAEKAKKSQAVSAGSSAPQRREPVVKAKPVAVATKPSAAATKTCVGAAAGVTAPPKRPTSSTSTPDRKPATARALPTAGPKRLSSTSTTRPAAPSSTSTTRPAAPSSTSTTRPAAPSTSTTRPAAPSSTSTTRPAAPSSTSTTRPAAPSSTSTARDVRPKTTTERRPLVAKPSAAASTGSTGAAKNGAASTRTTTRPAVTTAARRPLAPKTDSRVGDEKKPGDVRTSTDSTKPKTTSTTLSTASTAATASRSRASAAKPPPPSSSSSAVPEKKATVARAPRPASSSSTSTSITSSRNTARPSTGPTPDVRQARSKIGSTDNMKHQPGGGKVTSSSQSRAVASREASLGKVQIVSIKLDFSHVSSRLGSKENMKHVAGGGKVQILNKKVDLSKVTSRCGSKDNIKHKPGVGVAKIESLKVSFREKTQSKVDSVEDLSPSGGGDTKAEGPQETPEGSGPLSPGPESGLAGSPQNGLKEGESLALASHIPETSL
ncbi:microtubule-associated protein 4 isoform X3 [Pseudoliparis swirei]|nr:microtubule-associated protein 4 isoform X3 [Pseudoliparis swirei]